MNLLKPLPTPYEPLAWAKLPLTERARMVCLAPDAHVRIADG